MHDLVVTNARIADGLGNPLREADLAVDGGRVSEIGHSVGPGRETVDAEARVLAPGIIDSHTHYDAQLLWDPTASPSPALGVTTVVIGNCGFGIAPAPPAARDRLLADLAEVEGMPLVSLKAGVDWGFESFPEYLDCLAARGVYPNVAALASHTAIRTAVMGDESARRAATAAEVDEMSRLLREAMAAGAVGLGSSTNENHRGRGGIPIASRFAGEEEFDAFARVLSEFEHGVFLITTGHHMGIPFMEAFAEASGKPALYAAHFHYPHEPERGRRIMHEAEAARRRGHPVYTQGSCQPLALGFSLDAAYIMKMIEGWPATSDQSELARIYRDPAFRDRLRKTLSRPDPGRVFNGGWEWVIVTRTANPALSDLEGSSVQEIAARRGEEPLDVFFDVALEDELETYFTLYMLNMDEEGVAELIRNDGTLVSLSDAGAHNSLLCDAGFGMHLLGHWVRETGTFDLPAAVRKVTSDPARLYGMVDRGRLVPGAFADMVLFDPDTVGITALERHFDLPAGGERLLRRAPGLHGTWVNGVQVFDGLDYRALAGRPGRVLRRFAPPAAPGGAVRGQAA